MTAAPRRRRHDPVPSGPDQPAPPGPSTIDLHTHTTRSDGVVAPADLVRAAADCGVRLLALTDHDTLAGYREVVAAGAVPAELTLIPGVEINAIVTRDLGLSEGELHILGFGMDPADEAFEASLAAQRAQRRLRFERTLERLRELDLSIDAQLGHLRESDDDALGRPTVARALIAAGHATSVEDAFRRLLAWGKPAYVPRQGLDPAQAIAAIRAAGGLPALAHFGEAPARTDILRELMDAGLGGLEVYYRSFDTATTEAVKRVAEELGLVPTGGSDYHGDLGDVRRGPRPDVGPARGRRWHPGRGRRTLRSAMTDRSLLDRALPILEFVPPAATQAPRRPDAPVDDRVTEYVPEARTLPRFHMWTLGCQMNRSDSEEMAGRLLQAGCEEAASLEAADLIVINTCAIREGAEQKVIGRQGQLNRLKAANPGLRIVLTGCSVREPDRAGLRRRYPAVDLFLRPDEEPELVDRLGLASAQAPIGAVGATTTVGRAVVGAADGLSATRARAVGEGSVARGSSDRRLAADHLRLRQDVHLLHRAVQPWPRAEPSVRRHRR